MIRRQWRRRAWSSAVAPALSGRLTSAPAPRSARLSVNAVRRTLCATRLRTGVLLGSHEGEEAVVVLLAGRAAFEVCAHSRDLLVGGSAGELELDVSVELVEALLARQFRASRAEESAEH